MEKIGQDKQAGRFNLARFLTARLRRDGEALRREAPTKDAGYGDYWQLRHARTGALAQPKK